MTKLTNLRLKPFRFSGLDRFLLRFLDHHIIPDQCGKPYLIRYYLLGGPTRDHEGAETYRSGDGLYLHHILLSDEDRDLHDHPWPFWSLILWGGYTEVTLQEERWYGPLSLLKRSATWRHRVVLPESLSAWTLVWRGEKERSWGFWSNSIFTPWRQYTKKARPCEGE